MQFTVRFTKQPDRVNFLTLLGALKPVSNCTYSNHFNERALIVEGAFQGRRVSVSFRAEFVVEG
jgi:hypothetical protein